MLTALSRCGQRFQCRDRCLEIRRHVVAVGLRVGLHDLAHQRGDVCRTTFPLPMRLDAIWAEFDFEPLKNK
jgi:hypothetical protein